MKEIFEDPEALEGGPEIEDPFLPEVDLEGEEFAPLATSAKKSASAEALIFSNASPSCQERPKLTIWTAIFYPVPEIFVNLRFRGDASLHLLPHSCPLVFLYLLPITYCHTPTH